LGAKIGEKIMRSDNLAEPKMLFEMANYEKILRKMKIKMGGGATEAVEDVVVL
jgi:hypothetical protein